MKLFTFNSFFAAILLICCSNTAFAEAAGNSEFTTCGTLEGIFIYDQVTDQPIYGPIIDGDQININDLTNSYYLVAQTSGYIESVSFWVDGYSNIENVVHYTFPSGGENNNNWNGGIGTHNVDVNAYSSDNAYGNLCGQIWLSFDIIDACQNVTNAGAISSLASVCAGETITIVNDASPTGGSGDLEFIWLFNQNETNPNNAQLIESNTSNLTLTPYESGYYRRCARRSGCTNYDGESNWIYIEVDTNCQEPCNLTVDAGLDLETCGEELNISASINGASTCFNGCEHEVSAPERCGNSELFVFYINNAPGGQYFSSDNATFVQYKNGTAKFTADATNGTDNVSIDITYSDKTTIAPVGSPKENNCESTDASGWIYYQTTSGTVISQNHGTYSISRRGPAFQLGNTAMHIAPGFGASGWIDFAGGDGTYLQGDVNIQLNPNCNQIEGNDTVSILWSTGSTSESINVNSPGTYTVTVTDCNGCSATDEVIVTGCTDAPEGTLMTDLTIECGDDLPNSAPTFSSSCDDDLEITFNEDFNDFACGYEIVRTWFATDDCGNESDVITQTITIVDNTNPVFTSTPDDITINSINDLPNPGEVQATDNCGTVIMEFFESMPTDQCDGQILRTWTAVDACGNSIEHTQTITIFDSIDPIVVSAPENMTIDCEEIPFMEPVFEDNCDEDLDIVFETSSEENGDTIIITNTWTAFDNNNNSVTVTQVITVNIPGDPILIGVPADETVECNEIPEATLVVVEHDCEDLEVIFSEEITEGCQHTITRTWTATDSQGNSVSATQVITVVDSTPPAFVNLPNDTTVECGNLFVAPVIMATDHCDDDVEVTLSQFGYNGVDCSGVLTRVFVAIDDCGNEASHTQLITIIDNVAPTASNIPSDLTINCGEIIPGDSPSFEDNCDEDLTVSFEENQTDNGDDLIITRIWTALDACGNETSVSQVLTVVQSEAISLINVPQDITVECIEIPAPANVEASNQSMVSFNESVSGNCPYIITRTWSASNDCGNTATATQTIVVEDNTAPTFVDVPANISVTCGNVPPAASIDAIDLCDEDVDVSVSQFGYNGVDCSGVLTRIYTATDNCGNIAQHTQTITISDDIAPVASNVPADITFECGGNIPTDEPTFTDNCAGNINVEFSIEESVSGMTTTYIRTWIASDECGNETTVSQTVIISGNSNLELIGVPADLTVECNDVPSAANVTSNDGSIVSFQETISGDCPYFITRTWSATNDCGGDISASQIITVEDITAPVLSNIPADITVNCGEIPNVVLPSASDLCDNDVSVSLSQFGYNGVDCSGTLNRKFTATDNCGNTVEHIQVITIVDNIAPTFNGDASDMTVECNNIPAASEILATDNCGDVILDFNESISDGCPYTIIRTWTATDLCGNSSELSQVLTVVDNTAPELNGVPADFTTDCADNLPNPANVDASDACDTEVIVIFSEEVNGDTVIRTWTATDACGNTSSASQTITVIDSGLPMLVGVPANITVECGNIPDAANVTATDGCTSATVTFDESIGDGCPYTITRTWTAADDAGNTVEESQIITVEDTEAPVITNVPSDISLSCSELPEAANVSASDNCDSNVELTLEENTDYSNCPYILTRTWTATDECGNTSSATQEITLIDNQAPELIDFEAAIQVLCDETEGIFIQAEDNCSEIDITIVQDQFFSGACYGTIERTYLVEDACGNSTTAVQFLFLNDDEDPVYIETPEAEITIECGDEIPELEMPVAIDNCDPDVEIEVSIHESNDGICPYVITRVFIANDDCGNDQKFVQIINVNQGVIGEDEDVMITSSPNPVHGNTKVTFAVPTDGDVVFTVTNSMGQETQMIMKGEVIGGALNQFDLITQDWKNGVYYLKLYYDGKFTSHKIMKIK